MVRKANSRSIRPAGRRRDARRDLILRAAAAMFRERGFAETGMRDIAQAADLSAANLYHYFRGKDEILFYCQDRALDRMLDAVGRARRLDVPVPARLHTVLSAHLQTLLDDVEGATAHLQTDALSPALRTRIVRKRDRYEQALRALIALGVRRGECTTPDPALAARAMLGALNWTVTWFRPSGAKSASQVADEMAALLVRGVAVRSAAPARRLALVRPGAIPRRDET